MDNYSQSLMIGIGISFLILPIIAVGARLWSKLLCRKGIRLDDYLILGALAIAIGCCVTELVASIKGQLGQHQTVGADGQPNLRDPQFLIYEKCKLAVNILAILALGTTKASILVFYMNIFAVRKFKIWAYAMLGIVTAWTVSFFFGNLFTCYPISALIEPFYHNHCVDGLNLWYASAFSDFITDFMILAMPIPMVLKLQVHWHQKLAIQGMFLLGALVCAISVTRFVMFWRVGHSFLRHYNDETYYTSPVFLWTNIEISLSVVSACLPTYRPIWLYLKGTPVAAKKSYPLSSYTRFGSSPSHGIQWPGQDRHVEEDDRRLNPHPHVETSIETGQPSLGDVIDASSITVEQDMYTGSESRRFD